MNNNSKWFRGYRQGKPPKSFGLIPPKAKSLEVWIRTVRSKRFWEGLGLGVYVLSLK